MAIEDIIAKMSRKEKIRFCGPSTGVIPAAAASSPMARPSAAYSSGFQAGNLKYVIDQTEQMISGSIDLFQVITARLIISTFALWKINRFSIFSFELPV